MKTFKFYLASHYYLVKGDTLLTSATGQTLIIGEDKCVNAIVPVGTLVYEIESTQII